MSTGGMDYRSAGVDDVATALGILAGRVRETFRLAGSPGQPGAVRLDLGYFANVIELSADLGLAISTDGVGTKLLVAEMAKKYDTVGVDCIAMNVNDVLCVGARPIAMVDYIAVERADDEVLAAVADGLLEGARQAGISIPGGELAQVEEMVRGVRPGSGFDIVGTAVGLVPLDRVIVGGDLSDGDVVIGLTSSGIHSNGFTLARKALLQRAGYSINDRVDDLRRTIGEELLVPTRIYVRPILALLDVVDRVKALAHITGDGLLNLLRVDSRVGFDLDQLPEPQPIFQLIQAAGNVEAGEMYRVFNMGVGFCAVVSQDDADDALVALRAAGAPDAEVIGRVRASIPNSIVLPQRGLTGTREGGFVGLE